MSNAKRAIAAGAKKQPQTSEEVRPEAVPADEIAKGHKGMTYRSVMLEAALASVTHIMASREGSTVSDHLLTLAKGSDTLDSFLTACKATEKYIKSDAGAADVRSALEQVDADMTQADIDAVVGEVPASWRQAKNDIKRAWENGLNPQDFKTKRAMKDALNKKRKEGQPAAVKRAEQAKVIIRKSIPKSGKLLIALSHLTEALHGLPVAEQDKVAATIEGTAKEYAALAKKLVPVAPKKGTQTKRQKGKVAAPREAGAVA